jgi:hypothetical protein
MLFADMGIDDSRFGLAAQNVAVADGVAFVAHAAYFAQPTVGLDVIGASV